MCHDTSMGFTSLRLVSATIPTTSTGNRQKPAYCYRQDNQSFLLENCVSQRVIPPHPLLYKHIPPDNPEKRNIILGHDSVTVSSSKYPKDFPESLKG